MNIIQYIDKVLTQTPFTVSLRLKQILVESLSLPQRGLLILMVLSGAEVAACDEQED